MTWELLNLKHLNITRYLMSFSHHDSQMKILILIFFQQIYKLGLQLSSFAKLQDLVWCVLLQLDIKKSWIIILLQVNREQLWCCN